MAEDNLKCDLCQSTEKDELKYGKFYIRKKVHVHYFCLLLTSNMTQRGKDNHGILGFLINDIKKESGRIKNQICAYCGDKGANIGCCNAKCRRIFHFICGIKNGAQNCFFGTFQSFCHQHISKGYKKPSAKETCSICLENISVNKPLTMTIFAQCCKNGWFHKWCLQEFANKAGYFFKCPLCSDTSTFTSTVPKLGIFVPQKDADWELEPDAFLDLLERPNECTAPMGCICGNGKNFSNKTRFKFLICYTCGGKAVHEICYANTLDKNLKKSQDKYLCLECFDTLNKLNLPVENSRDSGVVIINEDNFENEIVNIEDDSQESDVSMGEEKKNNQSFMQKLCNGKVSENYVLPNVNSAGNSKKEIKFDQKCQKIVEHSDFDAESCDNGKIDELTVKNPNFTFKKDSTFVLPNKSGDMLAINFSTQNSNNLKNKNESLQSLSSCRSIMTNSENKNSKSSKQNVKTLSNRITETAKLKRYSLYSKLNNIKCEQLKSSDDSVYFSHFSNQFSPNHFDTCKNNFTLKGRTRENNFTLKGRTPHLKQKFDKCGDAVNVSSNGNGVESSKHKQKYSPEKLHMLKIKYKNFSTKSKMFASNQFAKNNNQLSSCTTGRITRSFNQNKSSKVSKNKRMKNLYSRDVDSDSSTSSLYYRYYMHNKNVLKMNLKNKLTPINLKIKSKYASRKLDKLACNTRVP